MKTLDTLIVVLILLVIASGGFLGYLVYDSYLNVETYSNDTQGTITPTNIATVAPTVVSCLDEDGDGYGEGCTKGLDCDDSDIGRNIKCETIEANISVTADAEIYNVGDEIEVITKLESLPVTEKIETLNYRLDFDNSRLSVKSIVVNPKFTLPIELQRETMVSIELANVDEGILEGDELVTITFEAKKLGTTYVGISENTRIGEVYELADENTIELSIE